MNCEHVQMLLNGLLDQELESPQASAVDTHLKTCPACQAFYQQLTRQRTRLQQQATHYQAPAQLRQRILDSLPAIQPSPPARDHGSRRWFNLGALAASLLAVSISVGFYFMQPSATDRLADEVIASHVRGLLTNRLTDVASSDQHTVKPWFNGKLDFSPPVMDLTTEGFPLLGGRLDYLDHRPVAALVYRHRLHYISLFVFPHDSSLGLFINRTSTQNGYHLLAWTNHGMDYWCVSDVNLAQLQKFRQLQTGAPVTPSSK